MNTLKYLRNINTMIRQNCIKFDNCNGCLFYENTDIEKEYEYEIINCISINTEIKKHIRSFFYFYMK